MDEKDRKPSNYFKPVYLVYILLIAIGIYLVAYHGPHLWTILPFLIFLACPVMHMMHHRKHKEVITAKNIKTTTSIRGVIDTLFMPHASWQNKIHQAHVQNVVCFLRILLKEPRPRFILVPRVPSP